MSTFIHLHTLDLRVHDSPSLFISHDPSSSLSKEVKHFLPVYIFDERALDISSLPGDSSPQKSIIRDGKSGPGMSQTTRNAPRSRICEFHRTSPHRLWNLLESVYSLRETYRRSGGDMIIGYGKPEVLLPQLIEKLGKEQVAGVWAQEEYTLEEANMLKKLRRTLPDNVKLELNQTKTLIPPKNLPFNPARATPDFYTSFRKRVEGMGLTLEEGGMLVPPLITARWSPSKIFNDVRVSVGRNRIDLKPFPQVKLDGNGWIKAGDEIDDIQGMYSTLVKPLLASPPIGGWSAAIQGPDKPPTFHPESALPSEGGGEESGLSRLEDYVGHEQKSADKEDDEDSTPSIRRDGIWVGGAKAKTYKNTRNGLVGEAFSSKFAGFLALGTLSAREAGWRIGELLQKVGKDQGVRNNVYWLIFELLWRDYLQFTTLHYSSKQSSLFDPEGFSAVMKSFPDHERPNPSDWHFPNWDDPNDKARRWCEGKTGVPFIDAAMIELRETGYMSNRVRQNVASFLTKDLYGDWRVGAEFFEMHLIDYDTCSNWGNWQYQAGVGNDPRASRQFNPIKQANDYDANAEYVKLWLPQLAGLPADIVHTPWLSKTGLKDYPAQPLVENPKWTKFYHKTPVKHSKNRNTHQRGGKKSTGTGTGRYGEAHRGEGGGGGGGGGGDGGGSHKKNGPSQ